MRSIGDRAEADEVAQEEAVVAEDVVLPEHRGDDGRALEAVVDVAPRWRSMYSTCLSLSFWQT